MNDIDGPVEGATSIFICVYGWSLLMLYGYSDDRTVKNSQFSHFQNLPVSSQWPVVTEAEFV